MCSSFWRLVGTGLIRGGGRGILFVSSSNVKFLVDPSSSSSMSWLLLLNSNGGKCGIGSRALLLTGLYLKGRDNSCPKGSCRPGASYRCTLSTLLSQASHDVLNCSLAMSIARKKASAQVERNKIMSVNWNPPNSIILLNLLNKCRLSSCNRMLQFIKRRHEGVMR